MVEMVMWLIGFLSAFKVKDNWTATAEEYWASRQSLEQVIGGELNERDYLTVSTVSSRENFKNGVLYGLDFAYRAKKMITSKEVLKQELNAVIKSIKEKIEASTIDAKKNELNKLLFEFKDKNGIEDGILEDFLKAQASVIQNNTDLAKSELGKCQEKLKKRNLSPQLLTDDQKKDFLAILGIQIELANLEKPEQISIADTFITTGDYEIIANEVIINYEKEQEKWQNLLNKLEIELKELEKTNEQDSDLENEEN